MHSSNSSDTRSLDDVHARLAVVERVVGSVSDRVDGVAKIAVQSSGSGHSSVRFVSFLLFCTSFTPSFGISLHCRRCLRRFRTYTREFLCASLLCQQLLKSSHGHASSAPPRRLETEKHKAALLFVELTRVSSELATVTKTVESAVGNVTFYRQDAEAHIHRLSSLIAGLDQRIQVRVCALDVICV
jgi:hypothetical protein